MKVRNAGLSLVVWVGSVALAQGEARPPERIEAGGIENLFRLSPRLYSGAQPEGAEGFAALERLGVRTIISVDGSTPDVVAARAVGLRYVHLPIGYDGVPRAQAVRLVQALRTLPGPVFIHCHHGQHRGPAAAAVCGIATEGWDRARAIDWMERAGTSPDYTGLFASVGDFTTPSDAELAAAGTDFPERVEVPDLVAMMVRVDATCDRLKAARAAGFRAPAGHPDLDPPHEALQLAEHFRELRRLDEARARGEGFLRMMESSERQASGLVRALKASREAADETFRGVLRSCTTCHARYRDH